MQLGRQHAGGGALILCGCEGTQELAREPKRGSRDVAHNPLKASTRRNMRRWAYQNACAPRRPALQDTDRLRAVATAAFPGICRETWTAPGADRNDASHTSVACRSRSAVVSRPTGVCFQSMSRAMEAQLDGFSSCCSLVEIGISGSKVAVDVGRARLCGGLRAVAAACAVAALLCGIGAATALASSPPPPPPSDDRWRRAAADLDDPAANLDDHAAGLDDHPAARHAAAGPRRGLRAITASPAGHARVDEPQGERPGGHRRPPRLGRLPDQRRTDGVAVGGRSVRTRQVDRGAAARNDLLLRRLRVRLEPQLLGGRPRPGRPHPGCRAPPPSRSPASPPRPRAATWCSRGTTRRPASPSSRCAAAPANDCPTGPLAGTPHRQPGRAHQPDRHHRHARQAYCYRVFALNSADIASADHDGDEHHHAQAGSRRHRSHPSSPTRAAAGSHRRSPARSPASP